MSLSTKAIDRLFERLAATYGVAWAHQWTSVPIADAKAAWAHELSGFGGQMDALAWGLENLPERCPNVIEFRNLCRRAPAPELPRLPEPKANPERLRAELAKLADVRAKVANPKPDGAKDWARRIIGRFNAGDKVRPVSLRFAREALGIK
jgi:hypothetical protein